MMGEIMEAMQGSECFKLNGKPQGFELIDFRRWNSSLLLERALRGAAAQLLSNSDEA